MLIIFGFTQKLRLLFTRPGTCPRCGVHGPQRIMERASKLTVFFIPLLTTRRSYYSECWNCGQQTALSRQQKDALAAA
ncbi:zinc-ribbon domain-containing protein [Arthrobacter mobilis]|uniref:Zinc-ribbon domain-containing protein n=1 Tax=Arthrobacter mobilis TaxID=2724944 RepID=A0A7X6K4S7_9MICC|nr:zinc-ribbon domain-containing protein [Arthrobacter mobilis]NKX53045.1 zinc-ribbon domain-containing protein [Arthrobacter mobilis]